MSSEALVIVTCLVGIGLLVLAGRIRAWGGVGPRPSIGRGLRGRDATSGSEPPPTVERELDERRERSEERREGS